MINFSRVAFTLLFTIHHFEILNTGNCPWPNKKGSQKFGGIPIDRGSDRPIIEKGPLHRGSDRPIFPRSTGPIIEKGR